MACCGDDAVAQQPIDTAETIAVAEAGLPESSLMSASSAEVAIDGPVDDREPQGKFYLHAGLLILNWWLADFVSGFNQ